jgi:hypothetical protein
MNQNVYRLVGKDVSLQKIFLPLFFLLEVAAIACMRLQLPHGLPGLTLLLTTGFAFIGNFMLCYRFAVAEEKDKAMLFIRTLPVSTRDIVLSKALGCLGFGSLNVLALFALYELLRLSQILGPAEPQLPLLWLLYILSFQWVGIGLFLALALLTNTDWAVWIPFPALFLLVSAILNFRQLLDYFGIADLAASLLDSGYPLLLLAVLLTAAELALTWTLVRRKRMLV